MWAARKVAWNGQRASWSAARGFRSSSKLMGRVPFKLADIGEGIAEVEVLQWFVKAGDKVEEFAPLCEVQSDKATVTISSRYTGTVEKLHWKVGDMAGVGKPLVDLEVEGKGSEESAAEPAPESKGAAPSAERSDPVQPREERAARPAVQLEKPSPVLRRLGSFSVDPVIKSPNHEELEQKSNTINIDKLLATPAVRRLARDHDIDLVLVPASGRDGRILKEDLLAYIKQVPLEERRRQAQQYRSSAARQSAPAANPALAASVAAPAAVVPAEAELQQGTPAEPQVASKLASDKVVPVKGIMRIMVKSMEESLKIPHFNFMEEYEMTSMQDFRAQLKASAEKRGIKLSYMPIIIKAASLSLLQFPGLNAHFSASTLEVVQKASHNIGVAMDTPRGLLVPVIKDCQDKSIMDIAKELVRLQQVGAVNKLSEADLTGMTFSLSNIGAIGGTYASPIIPSPTVAIGAIGRIQTLPRFRDASGKQQDMYAAKIMNISWAADHRVVDGATIARFSNQLKSYLENPLAMVSDMS